MEVKKTSVSTLSATSLGAILPLILVAVLVVSGFVGYQYYSARQRALNAEKIAAMQAEAANAIADRWGFRVVRIAPLAEGGMVELRFQVVDPDKVVFLFDKIENVPKLIDEDSGTEVSVKNLPHSHNVPAGLYEYIIYTNTKGAIQPGDLVTLVVGDLRLEHISVAK
jgi:hypothetical protein